MNRRKVLLDVYRTEREKPFVWGESDCLSLAVRCAVALGHTDLQERHAALSYRSEDEARALMAMHGCAGMGDVAATLWPEIPVAQAAAGDWVEVANPDGTSGLGVVMGEAVMLRMANGLGRAPLTAATRAFRVWGA